jgi:hypothetical protein
MEHDLADDLDDLITCNGAKAENENSSGGMTNTAILIFTVWIGLAVVVYFVANLVLQSIRLKVADKKLQHQTSEAISERGENESEIISTLEEAAADDVVAEAKLDDKEVEMAAAKVEIEAPRSMGSDLEAVTWVNGCLEAIFTSPSLRSALITLWMDAMTAYTKSTGLEVLL